MASWNPSPAEVDAFHEQVTIGIINSCWMWNCIFLLMLCSPCRQSNGFGTLWNLEMRYKATNAFVLHHICIAWYFMYHKCFINMATSSNFLARVSKLTCTCYTSQCLANYLNLFYRCGEEQSWFKASLFFKQPPWCSSWNHQKWRTLGDACKWNWWAP